MRKMRHFTHAAKIHFFAKIYYCPYTVNMNRVFPVVAPFFKVFGLQFYFYFSDFLINRMNKFEPRIKLCAFEYTYYIFYKKKNIGNVEILDYISEKRGVFTRVAKSKKRNCFAKIYSFQFDSS